MKFDYEVKHNGRYYPAGADVPVGIEPKRQEVEVVEEKPQPKVTPKRKTKK